MYLAFGPDGYIRYGLDDPLAALASRTATFNEFLHHPPWAAEWIVAQAREHRIDAALVLHPRSMKPSATGRLFIERALEEAGIPVLPVAADVVDARAWDAAAARRAVGDFLDERVLQMTTAISHASRPAWLLPFGVTLIAMFSLQLSNLGFSPLLPSIQADVGMSFTQLGFFTGIYGLLAMLLSVPAGLTAKRFGEKRVLAAGLVGVAIGSVLLGRAWNFESAVAFRGLTIFGYRFAFVSVLIAVALTAPPKLRGRTMGVLGATSAMASVVGAPLGGVLVGEVGWRSAILGYASMALLGAIVFWLFYRVTAEADAAPVASSAAQSGATPRSAFRSPVVWLLALVVGLGGFGQFTITYFVPSVADAVYGLNAAAAGVIISTGYIAAIVLNLFIGVLADRFDKLVVLGGIVAILVVASASLTIEHELVFRIGHGRRHRFRLLRREPALWAGRQLDAAPRSRQRDGHREPRRRAVRLFRPADARHPARHDGLVHRGLLHGGHRGSLDARIDRAALSNDSTRNVRRDCRCIGASSS